MNTDEYLQREIIEIVRKSSNEQKILNIANQLPDGYGIIPHHPIPDYL